MLKNLMPWQSKRGAVMDNAQADSKLEQPVIPFDTYETSEPSAQNAIDLVPGWNTHFPSEFNVVAGKVIGFQDDRIGWMIERLGGVDEAKVLEIGPMEAAHSVLLERSGAQVTAVEANKRAFLKCLITKEIVGLTKARFLLGDCIPFLENNETRYDVIVACGVLYHMQDPLRFLEAVAARTDSLFIWTSYIDDAGVAAGGPGTEVYNREREDGEFHGKPVTLYRRGYLGADQNEEFCGGIFDDPRWMARTALFDALGTLGFNSIEIAHEATPVLYEPCFSILARRV